MEQSLQTTALHNEAFASSLPAAFPTVLPYIWSNGLDSNQRAAFAMLFCKQLPSTRLDHRCINWGDIRESNPRKQLHKLWCYHYTNATIKEKPQH
jgi:hypothetical protein